MKVVPDTIALNRLHLVWSLDMYSYMLPLVSMRDQTLLVLLNLNQQCMQVTVTLDIPSTGLSGLLVIDTETGVRTERWRKDIH